MPDDQSPSTQTPEVGAAPEPLTPVQPIQPVEPAQPIVKSPTSKKKRTIIVAAIIAAAIAILGGGSALAYNLWYQNPDRVVAEAIANAVTAKTVSATGTMEIEGEDYKVKIEASGRTMEADGTVAVKVDYSGDDINYSIDGEGIFSTSGDLYVKLNDAKKLAQSIEEQSDGMVSFEVFDEVINKVDGKWIKISQSDLGEVNEEYEKSQKCIADISKKLEENEEFRDKTEDEIEALYKENKFIIIDKKLGSRDINGQGSLGYRLTGNSETADAFFTKLGDTEFGKSVKDCNKDFDFSTIISDEMKKEDSNSDTSEVQLWVSRFGHEITEVKVTDDSDGTKGSVIINPTFNKSEAITVPTDVIEFTELQADIEKAYEDYYQSYYAELLGDTDTVDAPANSSLFN